MVEGGQKLISMYFITREEESEYSVFDDDGDSFGE